MKFKTLFAAAAVTMTTGTAAVAVPVDFTFSFTDGTRTITGLIEGLDSDGLGQKATNITIYGGLQQSPSGVEVTYKFGLKFHGHNTADPNHFDVSGSVIDASTVRFSDMASSSYAGDGEGILNICNDCPSPYASFFEDAYYPTSVSYTLLANSPVTFSAVAAVPLPAGGLLLLSGLGGVAALKRRKKRAA